MRKNKQRKNRPQNSREKSQINPLSLVKKATKTEYKGFVSDQVFEDLKLESKLLSNITEKGYRNPTEIQEKSISAQIENKDLIGIAETGSGKTGAFLIPIINKLLSDRNNQSIIIVPTRELAIQVFEEFLDLSKNLNFQAASFVGGTNVRTDINKAKRRNDFIVGTPGRIKDMAERGCLRLNNIKTLVLDEFDRMLDMGFIKDIQYLKSLMENRRQTVLFSATLDTKQESIIKDFVTNPVRVQTNSGLESSDRVDQDIIKVKPEENKLDILAKLLAGKDLKKVIIFTETKRLADKLSKQLEKRDVKSGVIHGDKTQSYRTKAINTFKRGKSKVLIATDVAARGIDIKDISHVINYQIPSNMDSYIHRIGRTGRAGKTGKALTFIN